MNSRSTIHIAYLITIAVKGLDGVIETLLGLLIALTGPDRLYALVLHFTTPELENGPGSRAAAAVQKGAADLTHGSVNFVIFFLLCHGILKTGIAVNLLRGRSWIFAPACAILAGFILYMSYHAVLRFSWWLVGFTLFDLVTLGLVVNEWTITRRRAV